jgi:hypothetical protein
MIVVIQRLALIKNVEILVLKIIHVEEIQNVEFRYIGHYVSVHQDGEEIQNYNVINRNVVPIMIVHMTKHVIMKNV